MKKYTKNECFISDNETESSSYENIIYDLKRMELLNQTINELIERANNLENKLKKDNVILNYKITKLANMDAFATDKEIQALVRELQEKLKIKKELFAKKNKMLKTQLSEFRRKYYELFNKKISINCGHLINEIENNIGEKVYYDLCSDVAYPSHLSLNKILKKIKKKSINLDVTISDKKIPEKEKNKIFYSKNFSVDLERLQARGVDLSFYVVPDYKTDLDGKKYTYLKVKDIYNTNIYFKLGDLIKEKDDWRPIDLIKESVLNYKQKEAFHMKKNQKTKKI